MLNNERLKVCKLCCYTLKLKIIKIFSQHNIFFLNSNPEAKTTPEPKKGCSNVKNGCLNKIKPKESKASAKL